MSIQHKRYKAFLFDLNGTMIDDMIYHIKAWYNVLNKSGANISLEKMREECYGKNHELLERMFPGRYNEDEKNQMSYEKEIGYQQEVRPNLKLIDSLETFLRRSHEKGIKTAIGSAAIQLNIDFVLDGLSIKTLIDAVVSADDVLSSKPHPETFIKCAKKLKVPPKQCLVFEDAPKGVESSERGNGLYCYYYHASTRRVQKI